jgi:multiple sugar transport system permease protein
MRTETTTDALNASVVVSVLIILIPIYWTFKTAFTPQQLLFADPQPIVPSSVTLTHIISLINSPEFQGFFLNTVLMSSGVVILTVITSTLGGYGLARFDLPYKQNFARMILFGYMFPGILLAIPMYILWSRIGLINNLLGATFALTAITTPFSLWLMWNFFQTIPLSLEEYAQMAGATEMEALYQVALPMAKPGIAAIAVFSFAIAWGSFTIPTILLVDNTNWVLTQGLDFYINQHSTLWGEVMAVCALMMIPPFLFVFFLQRALLRGFRVTGM